MEAKYLKVKKNNQSHQWLLIIGIIFIAFNLRPAITSIGPLINTIQSDLHLSSAMAGLITSLPLIAFAVISPLVPYLGRLLRYESIVMASMLLIIIGMVIRFIPLVSTLLLGTLVIGVGIAVCNVLTPGIIKEKFSLKIGIVTSIYTTSMVIFASLASGLIIPLAKGMQLGWSLALLLWSIPAFITIIIWLFIKNRHSQNLCHTLM